VAGVSNGTAVLSKQSYTAGIPDLDNDTQIIIAYTSSAPNGAGNYMCYVRQANSVMFEGADIRDLTVTTLKIGHEAVTVPLMVQGDDLTVTSVTPTPDYTLVVETTEDFDPMGGGALVMFSGYCDAATYGDNRCWIYLYVNDVLKFSGKIGNAIDGGSSTIFMPFSCNIAIEGPVTTPIGVAVKASPELGIIALRNPTITILGSRR